MSATSISGQPDASTVELYRASPIKRRKRTRAQTAQLEQQIMEVLEADHPQSIRHVFYHMTNPRLPEPVDKSENGYDQVQHRIREMRRYGRLPYQWISDASRRGYFTNTYKGFSDFLRQNIGLYRADLWESSKWFCEVWCESRSIASVILDDCRELAVSLYPAGGFSSISFAYEAAQDINDSVTKPVIIFYIGDYDQSGVLIDVSIESELRRHLKPEIELTFKRLAITEEQIVAYDLPTKPRKKNDKRAPQVKATVEAEALRAGILRQLLRDEIEALLPKHALEVAKAAEESEQKYGNILADVCEKNELKERKKKNRRGGAA